MDTDIRICPAVPRRTQEEIENERAEEYARNQPSLADGLTYLLRPFAYLLLCPAGILGALGVFVWESVLGTAQTAQRLTAWLRLRWLALAVLLILIKLFGWWGLLGLVLLF